MAYLFKKRKPVPALELNSLVMCLSGGSLCFKAFALRPASGNVTTASHLHPASQP